MAEERLLVKWLKDKTKNKFFPRTHLNAVKDDDGIPLGTLLSKLRKQLVTDEQMENMIINGTWEEGVTYYTIEDE